jgi:hypothetical protein
MKNRKGRFKSLGSLCFKFALNYPNLSLSPKFKGLNWENLETPDDGDEVPHSYHCPFSFFDIATIINIIVVFMCDHINDHKIR